MNIFRRLTKQNRGFRIGKRKLHPTFCLGNDMATLETLKFDNLALRRLPVDSEERNYVRTVRDACFTKVKPTPVQKPVTVAYSTSAMTLLDLPTCELERKEFAEYFSGNLLLPGSDPAAHCYCGHQFGYFTGQLGDGAAMYLGEVINSKNERWEIQLKGAGLTPYSRTADGRKVMRSSIREFLCSEAMHFLNIPTTRAGSCVTSETEVYRDIFYDGHPKEEKCTVVLRIAPTFLRFGSFEIFKTMDPTTRRCGPSVGRTDILHQLLDYTIETFFPQIHANYQENIEEKYTKFFEEVVLLTARLVAEWQCVGFCHGVLNTDNMSIVGLTIDYGPFGFMDMYNPDHVCNASDDGGRYSYNRQPEMCFWNLKKLAETIEPALPLSISTKALELFEPEFNSHYLNKIRCKLGLFKEFPEDSALVEALFDTMEKTGSDFTNTFRCMSSLSVPGIEDHRASFERLKEYIVENCCYPLGIVLQNVKRGTSSSNIQLLLALSRTNPEIANHLSSTGFDLVRVQKKMELIEKLSEMSSQGKKTHDCKCWTEWLEMYSARLAKECEDGSQTLEEYQKKRIETMNQSNPRFILRNYILQNAIEKAESGDYTEVRKILKQLENPFSDVDDDGRCSKSSSSSKEKVNEGQKSFADQISRVDGLPPEWAFRLRVT